MKNVSSILLIFLIINVSVMILAVDPVKAEEPTLVAVLNTLGFTDIKESTVETFIPGTYNVTLYAEFADYHASNELSWYAVGTTEYSLIFSGPEGNFSYINPPIVKSFTANSKFGLSFLSPEARYFTETSKNPDGTKHAQIYVNLDDPDMFLIGFENLLGGGDKDYNDMVISLKLITPPIVNISGKNWYIRNATNNKAFIFLDGGLAPAGDGWVYILSFDDPRVNKNQKLPFINEIIQKGFDCLINKDGWYYDGSQTYVKDATMWLKDQGYKHVFLFGFSGGGVVIAYEIQKEYASTLFSAAVVASAPVAWDGHSGIYQSAHTAYEVKVSTSCICGETDDFYNQMLLYYNNIIVHKEFHTWEDGHDVFLYTCKDHPYENVSAAILSWYNAGHPPNTPLTPSGPTSGYRNVWYTYSTSTIDPNGDNVCYQFEFTGPNTNVSFTTGWYASGQTGSLTVMWETTDPPGTYYVRARAKDIYGEWSNWSPYLTVNIVNRAPNTPSAPSGPALGYVYTTYAYSTSTVDPDGDNVRYEFSWGDGTSNTITDWYASGSTVSASHSWTRPGSYSVSVRAQDVYNAWSSRSNALTVSISQNDAGTGGDAGNSFTAATSISPGSYKGTLYQSNPTDTQDWYQFYAESGESIYVSVTPPSGVDFDLQLYDSAGNLKAGSYLGVGYTDSVSYTADSTGYWRARIYIYSGEGQYSFYVSVYWPGGCPFLYVYDGRDYVCEGLLDIHNPDGVDVTYNHTLITTPKRVSGAYQLRLTEHPQTHSYIDQVKLFAVLQDKTIIELPLISATHSEYGDMLPQLLFSDDWKTDTLGANLNNGTSQSIDLKFAALPPNVKIIGFIFQIEGNNMFYKV